MFWVYIPLETSSYMPFTREDLTGKSFNRLLVLEKAPAENRLENRTTYKCLCSCGNVLYVTGKSLKNNNTKSCGCLQKEKASISLSTYIKPHKIILRNGDQFGKLTVIQENLTTKGKSTSYDCLCICSKIVCVAGHALVRGTRKSCGCSNKRACSTKQYPSIPKQRILKNIIGNRYFRLVVIDASSATQHLAATKILMICHCDCGKLCIVRRVNLINRRAKSCGCLRRQKQNIQKTSIVYKALDLDNFPDKLKYFHEYDNKYVIYTFTNLINNKVYVGQSINFPKRLRCHIHDALNPKMRKMLISRALHKYGLNNFDIKIIEEVSSIDDLNVAEIKWIRFYQSQDMRYGYNIELGGGNVPKSEITKEKLRQNRLGKKHSQETKDKLRNIMTGRVFSQETKQKLSISKLGDKNPNFGKPLTIEQRQKMMAGRKESMPGNAKLNKQIVSCIREEFRNGMNYDELLIKYKVTRATISRIINNKIWK